MKLGFVKLYFRRDSFMPILNVFAEGYEDESKNVLLRLAVHILNVATKFEGKPFGMPNKLPKFNSEILVSFSLIFPSEDKYDNFVEKLERGKIF